MGNSESYTFNEEKLDDDSMRPIIYSTYGVVLPENYFIKKKMNKEAENNMKKENLKKQTISNKENYNNQGFVSPIKDNKARKKVTTLQDYNQIKNRHNGTSNGNAYIFNNQL